MKRDAQSIATYNLIEKNGLLSKRRKEVYSILFKNGALTAMEVVEIAKKNSPNANQTGWNARFSELANMGAIIAVGVKMNPVSKSPNTVWDISGRMPNRLLPKPSRKEKIQEIIGLINKYQVLTDKGKADPSRTLLENAITKLRNL